MIKIDLSPNRPDNVVNRRLAEVMVGVWLSSRSDYPKMLPMAFAKWLIWNCARQGFQPADFDNAEGPDAMLALIATREAPPLYPSFNKVRKKKIGRAWGSLFHQFYHVLYDPKPLRPGL